MTDESKTPARRFKTSEVVTISAAHFIHDIFTAFLAPLLPLLIDKLGLSLLQAGSLTAFSQIPSLLNPLIGSLADRGSFSRMLVIVTPGITGALICLIGLAPSYATLAVLLTTSGISIAAIHVTGPAIIAEIAGKQVGRGMGLWMLGGELARTAGPLLAVQAATSLTLEGLWKIIPVCVMATLVLWWRLGRIPLPPPKEKQKAVSLSAFGDIFRLWRRMGRLIPAVMGVLFARAFMAGAAVTFLPTFMYGEGSTLWFANIALAILELAGAAGAIISGSLSDTLGRRKVLLITTTAAPITMLLFLLVKGPFVLLALVGMGFFTLATTPVLLAAFIENSGSSKATAGGTFMMLSFLIRSAAVIAVGAMGDAFGLRATYLVCAIIAMTGVPFVFLFPKPKEK